MIAAEVGGTVEAASTEAQIELYDALIDGCREAVKGEILDPKVCPFLANVFSIQSEYLQLFQLNLLCYSFRVHFWIFLVFL